MEGKVFLLADKYDHFWFFHVVERIFNVFDYFSRLFIE